MHIIPCFWLDVWMPYVQLLLQNLSQSTWSLEFSILSPGNVRQMNVMQELEALGKKTFVL
jgi:hypothetical protein